MPRFQHHFQYLPGDPIVLLDRLIGIGVGPDGKAGRSVIGLGKGLAKQLGGIGLGEQLAFEIEPRRQVVIGMGGPRIAIDAAMLAAAIGVDRAVEGQVGRLVVTDDRFGKFDHDLGPQLRGRIVDPLAFVEPVAIDLAILQVESLRYRIGRRTPTVSSLGK